jgi:hypothetical protein
MTSITLKDELAFIAAQHAHFHKVLTGEPIALFAARMHVLESSLIADAGAPASAETIRTYYAEIKARKIKNDREKQRD